MEILFFFVFFYPLFMALFWMMGAVMFFVRRERKETQLPVLTETPLVSILVPCHNEELCIEDTISHLANNKYPNLEIVAIDDGSSDRTGAILASLAGRIEHFRVVSLTRNYGKALALRAGAMASRGDFLMCVDADALLDTEAIFWMMRHMIAGPRVGAVTGNPRVLNRNSLLARIQIGEFSAIIGMIKRTQRAIGRLFTVSGVNALYRKSAVHHVGYWSPETVTEDVDISWRLQLAHWDIRYEPKALTWILVPENLRSLWRQRFRWARGGYEAATRYAGEMRHWVSRRMWTVFFEYWLGVAWSFCFSLTIVFWACTQLLPASVWPASLAVPSLMPGWTGVILGVVCLVQFMLGLYLDSHYERRGLLRFVFWAIWYPAIYWLINALTTLAAAIHGLGHSRRPRTGTWRSPGRGSRVQDVSLHRNINHDRRHYYHNRLIHSAPGRLGVLLLTAAFWGLWSYLVAPLLSLLLWLGGIYLFTDRMIELGGYYAFGEQLVSYAGITFAMWAGLSVWVLWNMFRYGRRNNRLRRPEMLEDEVVAQRMGLSGESIQSVQHRQHVFLHYNEHLHMVLEKKAP
ncbi:MAG: poly-beta-1,6-N-acetyl-D-glucosamine synthase [Acidiferrobacteraceae bacterium]|jgi:biofilm PGA synthesis N-glycosyltransferase PgaC